MHLTWCIFVFKELLFLIYYFDLPSFMTFNIYVICPVLEIFVGNL